MLDRALADLVVVFHFVFILFAAAGGLLAVRYRWLPFVHVPAVVWGVYIELSGGVCPLTPLEITLRRAAGASGYSGGFVEHYVVPVIYPAALSDSLQLVLAGLLVLANLGAYSLVLRHELRRRGEQGEASMSSGLEGGGLCRSIRYVVRGEPIVVALCHCSMCRRSAGAPVVAWAMFPLDRFELVRGEPAVHASSPGVERAFCGRCGTQLTFRADFLSGLVDVTVVSLDDPAALPPRMHIWESRRLPWLTMADALPRHAELPPQS